VGLRDHLDDRADFHIASSGYLRDAVNTPTSSEVPGGTTIDTEQLVQLLPGKPLILTTTAKNPTIPGAILVNLPNSGSLTDEWQEALGKLVISPRMAQATADRDIRLVRQLLDQPQSRVATDRTGLQQSLLVSRRLGGLGRARPAQGAACRQFERPR